MEAVIVKEPDEGDCVNSDPPFSIVFKYYFQEAETCRSI